MRHDGGVIAGCPGRGALAWCRVTVLCLLCNVALLAGCAGDRIVAPLGRASPSSAGPLSGVYQVARGDTLYSIAWRYGLDHRDLARWNGITDPYRIYPGQRLRTSRPAELPAAKQRAPAPPPKSKPRASTAPAKSNARVPAPRPAPPRATPPRTASSAVVPRRAAPAPSSERAVRAWRWPAKGKVTGTFAAAGGKGIDIVGAPGSPVLAAAPGRVVYSGSGLRGYGKLIIVKHNKRYLSAYAHNDRLRVKEGDTVKSGQRIADMGSSDAKRVMLHFEIRRDGTPVDPARYLPR